MKTARLSLNWAATVRRGPIGVRRAPLPSSALADETTTTPEMTSAVYPPGYPTGAPRENAEEAGATENVPDFHKSKRNAALPLDATPKQGQL